MAVLGIGKHYKSVYYHYGTTEKFLNILCKTKKSFKRIGVSFCKSK